MPMLAKPAATLPAGAGWLYEPKLDGFRALVHFDGRQLHIDSRKGNPLDSHFPDLVARLPEALGPPCVLDGELVIGDRDGLDFEQLQARLSRGRNDSEPVRVASFVAFDLLAWGTSIADFPFAKRRRLLERHLKVTDILAITPQTDDVDAAQAWMSFDAIGVEGVVAKRDSLSYRPGQRVMIKVRRLRSFDCVVGGYVPDARGLPAALVLGLYDGCGVLHHVGNSSVLPEAQRKDAGDRLGPHRGKPSFVDGRMPGYGRWSGQRDLVWLPIAPEAVCEVTGGNIDGGRFRHSLRFLRWRPDRDAWDCRTSQLR
jgi:ATP-dependent DNA ligase